MSQPARTLLQSLALVVGVLFALGVVLSAGTIFYFGSSKVRPLFGLSADALAGDDSVRVRKMKMPLDAGQADAGC